MNATTTVTIDFWSLVGSLAAVIVAFALCVWAFGTLLVKQIKEQLDERFTSRDAKLSGMESHIDKRFNEFNSRIADAQNLSQAVERDVLRLRADLPNDYVRREDWIRFSGVIDAKLDWLRQKGEETRQLVASIESVLRSTGGKFDGR